MHYAALVPCVLASYIASGIAKTLGGESLHFDILFIPDLTPKEMLCTCLLSIAFGLVSTLFIISLHQSEAFFKSKFKNPYYRAIFCGCLVLIGTLLVGSQTYNGAGTESIGKFLSGDVKPWQFILKILFTSISIAAGYKGGEIIPSLFIGASFGSLMSVILGLDPSLCCAVGMGSVFCGVTNCPITSLLLCFELFGSDAAAYFLISISLSYVVSGYYSLYRSQKIVYSKFKSNYIDKKAQ